MYYGIRNDKNDININDQYKLPICIFVTRCNKFNNCKSFNCYLLEKGNNIKDIGLYYDKKFKWNIHKYKCFLKTYEKIILYFGKS